jgi:Tfp pilus assembly protein PilN
VGGLSQFISNDTKVQSGVFVFEFVNSSLEKFSISPNKEYFGRLQIENEIINAKDLLLYAPIIELLYPSENFDNNINEITTVKDEIIYLNIFNKLGISVLIILLFSLFASYLVLDNYTQKNVALQKSIYELRKSNNQILAYKNSIAVKERIINKVGISNKYLHSYILHQLVKDMPNDVVLDKLHLHPLYKKTSKKRNYQTNLISITGQTTKIASFNNWILNLKQQKWVKNISIDSYKKSKKGYDIFKIIIHKNQNVL